MTKFHITIICALLLAACATDEAGDAGTSDAAVDGGTVNCADGRLAIANAFKAAAATYAACSVDADCVISTANISCEQGADLAINKNKVFAFQSAIKALEPQYCTHDFVEVCGNETGDGPYISTACKSSVCVKVYQ